ncbi:MAG TPA: hypothetical protein VNS12_13375 [Pelagibacterium sp.]|uniref:hypothetical protein n=1 Tax=Pelagibacterium sp. TaxID=1967288 RepID=UPI002C595EC7|nr:hypothetical protein [Pelagibacterium sp.]HWJ89053.1 hypothetical protein [Pelagibacterium sp.]
MTGPADQDDGFYIGDCVRILGSAIVGFITGWAVHMRKEATYWVEYIDGTGSPQEREWSESQLSLVERHDDADAEEAEVTGVVVPFPVAN